MSDDAKRRVEEIREDLANMDRYTSYGRDVHALLDALDAETKRADEAEAELDGSRATIARLTSGGSAIIAERDEARAEAAATRAELHRWQHGEEIEGDYACKPALDAQVEIDALRAEVERLRRRIESTPPWTTDGEPLTDEQLRALKLRWSTGPEQYQSDADALIATVITHRREVERLRVAGDALRAAMREAGSHAICIGPTATPATLAVAAWDAARRGGAVTPADTEAGTLRSRCCGCAPRCARCGRELGR